MSKKYAARGGLFNWLLHSNRRSTIADGDTGPLALILRKAQTALRDPGAALRIAQVRLSNELARRRLAGEGMPELISGRNDAALLPEWADLLNLYQLVRAHRPRTIMEFGSGCSTVVLAHALRRNRDEFAIEGRLHSMERDAGWLDVSRRALPDDLRSFVEFHYLADAPYPLGGVDNAVHPVAPGIIPDMIYVDDVGGPDRHLPTADPAVLDRFATDGLVIVVDGRPKAVEHLQTGLTAGYRYAYNPTHGYSIFKRCAAGAAAGPFDLPIAVGGRTRQTNLPPRS